MRMMQLVAALLLVVGCGGETIDPDSPRLYRSQYPLLMRSVANGLERGDCKLERTCGELGYVNCRAEVDGPAYYINTRTGQVLEVCGGACMVGTSGYCVSCPPPEWTCAP